MAPARILVVDDEPALRDMLSMLLEDEGYEVHAVSNGVEALTSVDQTRPAVVVTDVMMPEMDGIALCRALTQNPATATLPIVMTSAVRNRPALEHCRFAAFLPKPMNFTTLLRVIAALVDTSATAEPAG